MSLTKEKETQSNGQRKTACCSYPQTPLKGLRKAQKSPFVGKACLKVAKNFTIWRKEEKPFQAREGLKAQKVIV